MHLGTECTVLNEATGRLLITYIQICLRIHTCIYIHQYIHIHIHTHKFELCTNVYVTYFCHKITGEK